MSETTVYVVEVGNFVGDLAGVACTEEKVLWDHVSSSPRWLRRDLTDGFADRKRQLAEMFPDGYRVEYVSLGAPMPVQIAHHFRPVAASTSRETGGTETR